MTVYRLSHDQLPGSMLGFFWVHQWEFDIPMVRRTQVPYPLEWAPATSHLRRSWLEEAAKLIMFLGAGSYKCWEIWWMNIILENKKKIYKPKYKILNVGNPASQVGMQTRSRKSSTIHRSSLLVHWFFHSWGWKRVRGPCFRWRWKVGCLRGQTPAQFPVNVAGLK